MIDPLRVDVLVPDPDQIPLDTLAGGSLWVEGELDPGDLQEVEKMLYRAGLKIV